MIREIGEIKKSSIWRKFFSNWFDGDILNHTEAFFVFDELFCGERILENKKGFFISQGHERMAVKSSNWWDSKNEKKFL